MSIKEKVLKEKDYRALVYTVNIRLSGEARRNSLMSILNEVIDLTIQKCNQEKKKQVEWLKEEVDNMPLAIEDDVIPDVVVKWFLKKIDEAFPDLKESFTKEKNVFKN